MKRPNARFEVPRVRKTVSLLSLVLVASTAGCGRPFVLLPGGPLECTTAAAPDDWSFTDTINTVQLETRPADPYSVNIWVIALGDRLYVHAGTNRAEWVEHMEEDAKVRMRVEESIYELAAARVNEQAEFDRFSDSYEKKYGRRPGNESATEAYLFRLEAR